MIGSLAALEIAGYPFTVTRTGSAETGKCSSRSFPKHDDIIPFQ